MGKAETTKQSIIEKAAVIFNKNGYQRTSMAALSRALGLTKGAIYGNFPDKDTLAVEAFRFSVQNITERFRSQLRPSREPVAKLRAYARLFLTSFDEMALTGGCPVLNTAADADDAHPRLHAEVRRVLVDWEKSIVAMVNEGKESGALRADADGELFAASFIALIEGGILLAKTVGDKKYLESSVARIDRLIVEMTVQNA